MNALRSICLSLFPNKIFHYQVLSFFYSFFSIFLFYDYFTECEIGAK